MMHTPTTAQISDSLLDAQLALERGDQAGALARIQAVMPLVDALDADRLLAKAVLDRGARALDSAWLQRRLKKQSA